ncbi:MAG: hypothetical protein ACO1OO_03260 [Flavisolibacter sp.]
MKFVISIEKMPERSLKDKLIEKIRNTEDLTLLQEAYYLFELQEAEVIYEVNKEQRSAIEEARKQVKEGQTLSGEQADKEAEEWLDK